MPDPGDTPNPWAQPDTILRTLQTLDVIADELASSARHAVALSEGSMIMARYAKNMLKAAETYRQQIKHAQLTAKQLADGTHPASTPPQP